MLRDICNLLRDRMNTVRYFDRVAGLVQTAEHKIMNEDGSHTIKRFPISPDIAPEYCLDEPIRDLVPDSSKRGIVYFEATNVQQTYKRYTFGKQWEAQVRLVSWLNKDLINGGDPASVNAEIITSVISALQATYTAPPFKNIRVVPRAITENSPAIFGAYTYDNVDIQYLMAPYTYFAIDLLVTFVLPETCVPSLQLNVKQC